MVNHGLIQSLTQVYTQVRYATRQKTSVETFSTLNYNEDASKSLQGIKLVSNLPG